MGDHDEGAGFGGGHVEAARRGQRIEGAQAFVEHQQVGIGQKGAGEAEATALALRQGPAATADAL